MKIIIWILTGLLLFFVVFSLYIRFKTLDMTLYQYRPSEMPSDGQPHDFRLIGEAAPEFDIDPETLMNKAQAAILAEPRTELLHESNEGWALFQQRTALMAFPDFISIEAKPIEGSSRRLRLEIVSRSHYGKSDLGTNQKRVERWLAAIRDSL